MIQKAKLFVPAAVALLAGCGVGQPADPVTGYAVDTVKIVSVHRPKHFSVDVRDSRGHLFASVARSKHCNSWQTTARPGATYVVPFKVHRSGARTLMDGELKSLLCP